MRTIVDRSRMAWAGSLLVIAVACLAVAGGFHPDAAAVPRCSREYSSNNAILACVARRAAASRPQALATAAAITGYAGLAGALIVGRAAVRRLMTIHQAAAELGIPTSRVRQWMSEGTLSSVRVPDGTQTLVDPEEVRRLSGGRIPIPARG